ncbi:MAG: hypothetical protein AAF928_05900 [Myxococcota bacterium]
MHRLTVLAGALALAVTACAAPVDEVPPLGHDSAPLHDAAPRGGPAAERLTPHASAASANIRVLRDHSRRHTLDPSGIDPNADPDPDTSPRNDDPGADGSLDDEGLYPDGTEPDPPPEADALPDGTIPGAPPASNPPSFDPDAPSPDGTVPDPNAPSADGTDPDAPSDALEPAEPTIDPADPCFWSDGTIHPSCLP